MGSRRQQRDARRQAFLDAFRLTGNVSAAAAAVEGLNRATVYRDWLSDPEFRQAFEDAEQEATDALELEARRRALEGVDRLKMSGGRVVTVTDPDTGEERPVIEREYSDTLMVLLLKAHRPDKYRERQTVEMSGPGGGPIAHAEVDPELVAGALRILGEEGGGAAPEGGAEPIHPPLPD